ncbi:hypothetical protein DFH08DRAFT_824592 [Mycena albidolilacea]|uniref:Uncharacterized protein n=1 Tax=Mycena albidolilacea TaxID=1033008 RepID=A0AAD6Z3M2_9AGAR|nr:hypothetical protein DFH08DRAFT_824592 [Mycena albidolilacea]
MPRSVYPDIIAEFLSDIDANVKGVELGLTGVKVIVTWTGTEKAVQWETATNLSGVDESGTRLLVMKSTTDFGRSPFQSMNLNTNPVSWLTSRSEATAYLVQCDAVGFSVQDAGSCRFHNRSIDSRGSIS